MIVTFTNDKIKEAKKMLSRIFPLRGPVENMYFFAYKHRIKKWIKPFLKLFGIYSIEDAWLEVNEEGTVCGIVGHYRTTKDFKEAVWISWYGVDPSQRGKGYGKKLLDYAIAQAREKAVDYVRLYTGDDELEKQAQFLYESRGLKETGREPQITYNKIYKELDLNLNRSEKTA
jgi:GNAT superfamily N-acetyltransferase